LNHDDKTTVGNVIHAEYENGAIEVIGQIKKEPYVTMLKKHDPNITGVSVQAGYIHNRCVKCGEKFFNEKAWRVHMEDDHGIKDGVQEVHGIVFDALSLVVSPEVPGVPTAKIELMETDRDATVMRLFETALKEHGIIYSHDGVAITSTEEQKKLSEPQDEHGCEPGEVWDGEKCVPKPEAEEQEQPVEVPDFGDVPECPKGQVYNPVTKACELVTSEKAQELVKQLPIYIAKKPRAEIRYVVEYILTVADRNVAELETTIGKQIAEHFAALSETFKAILPLLSNNRAIKETADQATRFQKLSEQLEQRVTSLENRMSRIRGVFKGHTKDLASTSPDSEIRTNKTPYEEKAEKA